MIKAWTWAAKVPKNTACRIGTAGHLIVFFWTLATLMLAPQQRLPWAALFCLSVCGLVYPISLQRLLRWRWLTMLALLVLPPIFFLGERNMSLAGLQVSSEGLLLASLIALRFIVVLVAVDGLTAAVEITAIASLLERAGLQGLGFSMGVALNLLPSLQHSATSTWRSLWMRGGFRKHRWRALRCYLVTVAANGLRRAEDIALAAEARGFSPDRARPMPLRSSRFDWLLTALAPATLLLCFVG